MSIFSRKTHNHHSLFLQVYNFVKFELDAVEKTKSNHQRLLTKLKKHPQFTFKLPNLKLVIDANSSSEDEEPLYQGHKLTNYSREKRYLEDDAPYIVQTVMDYFERRYGNLFRREKKYEVKVNSDVSMHYWKDYLAK